ncbi:MAG: hypothetical protein HS116_18555 [Planctomycetes bacterium]|nr:hypothetical protein [Planctomycetota bacterium]
MIVEASTGKEVDLRKAAPNVSWSKQPADEDLAKHGLQRVVETEKPALEPDQYADPGPVVKVGELWTRTWTIKRAAPREPDVLEDLRERDPKDWTDDELRRAVQALIQRS